MDRFQGNWSSPCRDGASHLRPYIDGVLSQTYENVQYIFVNDGSTDETEEIILSAKMKIAAKGWDFVYIKQRNAGQAAAVNAALKEVRGKYFSQIDSDDILRPEYLEKHCAFLESHSECKFCYGRVAAANEGAAENPHEIWYRHIDNGAPDNLFNDLIDQKNVPPLAFYMIDAKSFLDVVKLPF